MGGVVWGEVSVEFLTWTSQYGAPVLSALCICLWPCRSYCRCCWRAWAVCAVQVEEGCTMIYELSRGGGFVGWGWCAGVQFDLPSMGPNVSCHPLHV